MPNAANNRQALTFTYRTSQVQRFSSTAVYPSWSGQHPTVFRLAVRSMRDTLLNVRRFECMTSLPPVVALHDWTIEIAGMQFGLTQATRHDHTELWFGGPFTLS